MFYVLLLFLLVLSSTHCLEITVSQYGLDNETCQTGMSSCKTLDYALSVLDEETSNVIINVLYSHSLTKQQNYSSLFNLTIRGSDVMMTCDTLGVGLAFLHSFNITISNIQWIDCSIKHPTTGLGDWSCSNDTGKCSHLILPFAYSALFLFNCTDFILNHASFTSSRGSGVSLYNVQGYVFINDTQFINHTLSSVRSCNEPQDEGDCSPQSTGLYIELSYCENMTTYCYPNNSFAMNTDYYIVNCLFEDNANIGAYRNTTDILPVAGLTREQHWPFGRGGGMGVVFQAYKIKHVTLVVHGSHFRNNHAVYGGGMFLQLNSGYPDHNYFIVEESSFHGNTAELNGGGMEIVTKVFYNSDAIFNMSFRNHLIIYESNFYNNEAYWGGGVSFVTYPSNVSFLTVEMNRSNWYNNKYKSGAGAIGLLRKEKPERVYFFIPTVKFTNCSFLKTYAILAIETSLSLIACTVYSEGIALEFYGTTRFEDNSASALGLSDTGATIYGYIRFSNNTGFKGGAMFLNGKAWMTLTPFVTIEFLNNSAYEYGGGLYYLSPAPLEMNMSSSCFVWYKDPGQMDVPLKYWWVNVTFSGNQATQGGDAAYINDPEKCIWPGESSIFNPNRTDLFDYSGQDHNSSTYVIATPVKTMYFDSDSSQFTHSTEQNHFSTYSLMPGEKIRITIVTEDYFGHSVPTVLSIKCHTIEEYMNSHLLTDFCRENSSFGISGSRLVASNTMLDDLVISGIVDFNELVLVFKTNEPVSVILPLRLYLNECALGYEYDNDMHQCQCVDNDLDTSPILCVSIVDSPILIPCARHHYWVGNITTSNGSVLAYQFCRTGKCSCPSNRNCSRYRGYSVLPSSHNSMCTNGLSGPLCSQCSDNKSLTYNGYSCSHCSRGHKIILVSLIILECFLIVVVIIVFLKLNIRVSTAGFYGFLYFYSVLPLFLWSDLPTGLEATISIITGITSLDFKLLQYFDLCLFDDIRTIHYEVLHYIYPVAVVLLITAVIKMDQHCFKRVQFFAGNVAIQALCIILLISYTSVSETSLNILLPFSYQNARTSNDIQQKFVYVDPGVKYMDPTHHLPYWLIALTVELVFVLPFALLMVFAPWLMKFFNLSRIKPILDEYHNCFQDQYRWFAGVYLLARQAMFLISAVTDNPTETAYCQQLFCLFLLIFTATLQPYRNQNINRIDIFFLLLLTVISFSGYNPTAINLLRSSHTAVIAILSLLPFTCMVIGCIVMVGRKVLRVYLKHYSSGKLQSVLGDSDSFSQSSITSSNDTRNTEITTTRTNDLPPRFYDQEENYRQDERSRLLEQPRPAHVAFTGSRYYHALPDPKAPSINGPHTN